MKKQFDHWNVCSNIQVNYASSAKVETKLFEHMFSFNFPLK